MKAKNNNLKTLSRLLRGSKKYFIACIVAGIFFTCCDLLVPQIIRVAVDSVIGSAGLDVPPVVSEWITAVGGVGFFRERIWICAALVALLGLFSAALRYCLMKCNSIAGETLIKTSRDLLYSHIQHLPWSWHMKNPTGDIIQRCTSDVERIKVFFQEQFVPVFRISLLIIMSLAFMIDMNLKLALVALIMFPIIILYSYLFHRKIRARFTECDENEGVLSTIAQENLTGVRVVRAFGREDFERRRFEEQNQKYTSVWVKMCRTLSDFWAVGDFSSYVQAMLIIILGTVFTVRGSMTEGEFISFVCYNTMLMWPVRRLGRMISEMSKAGVSVTRISEILDEPEEIDASDASEKPMNGDIVFDNVSFAYNETKSVLHNVSFTIPAGKSFGILGGTGSGKSSLLLLLCRLYAPTSGRITVGGEDISSMPAKYVRSNIGMVQQEPFLFSRSIEDNIGICGADAETVREAAVTACINGDIESFSQGYETLVGERGVTLSGGQKQRVAIARMLTRKTPIIVFDDSLSAVDTQTDENIRAALKRDLSGATSIIVSHRITTLMSCDNVLVLERGKATQLGTPQELLKHDGLFKTIFDMQMAVGEEEQA